MRIFAQFIIICMTKTLFQAPFLRLTLYFATGAVLQTCFDLFRLWLPVAAVAAVFCVLSFLRCIRKKFVLRWFFGFGLFLLCISVSGILTRQSWQKSCWQGGAGEATIRVEILDDAVKKPKTLMFSVKSVEQKMIVYLPADSSACLLRAGDSIIVAANFEPAPLPYHRNHGIAAVAFVKKWEKIESSNKKKYFNLKILAKHCRRHLLARLRLLIPEEREFSLAAALAFGYRAEMDRDLKQTFSSTGGSHVLAVSGLHFSIVYGILYFVFSFLGTGKRGNIARQAIILPLMWFFAFFTGMSASVVRAASMMTLWGGGSVFGYRAFTLNTAGVAAFFMLLFDPLNLFDVGFQMSFAAVIAILLVYPRLVALYKSKNPLLNRFWQLSCVSVAAQIGVAPLSIYYFHQFPLVFLLTNIIAIPLTGLLLCMIPASLLLSCIFGNIEWMMLPMNSALHTFIAALQWIETIPNGLLQTGQIGAVEIFCLYVVLIAVLHKIFTVFCR